jgi:hypothetical protein
MFQKFLFAGFIASACWSCRPEPDGAELLDELVVSTNYDPSADFSEYSTYVLPTDTIGFVSNTDEDDTIRVYSSSFQYPRKVIQAAQAELDNMFTRVSRDEDPDLGINIYVVSNLNLFQQVVYPTYYSYYYGYSGYYYYPYIQTYATNTATLVVEIVDLKNRNNNQVKVIWNAYMGDVINSLDFEQQSVDAIHQAFLQSPYIDGQ